MILGCHDWAVSGFRGIGNTELTIQIYKLSIFVQILLFYYLILSFLLQNHSSFNGCCNIIRTT